jgi:hypothetical protein
MADDDGGRTLAPDELADLPVDDRSVRRVELAGRFVGEEERRPVCDRGADRDPLLLAAGKLARVRVRPIRQAGPFQQLERAPPSRGAAFACQRQGQLDDFADA